MRILLIGGAGQLGQALLPLLSGEVWAPSSPEVNLTRSVEVTHAFESFRPNLAINLSAYNFVDKAEHEPEQAFAVNAIGVQHFASQAAAIDAGCVHVSTDYVFGLDADRSAPYTETDLPGPVSVYGNSKLAGEYFVRSLAPRHLVVRTCGLYGRSKSAGKGNFVETMLRLADTHDELRVVNDQCCTPSSAETVADAIAALIDRDCWGLFHVTDSGEATWYEMAKEVLRLAGKRTPIVPITTAEFAAKAARPRYSVLCTKKTDQAIGRKLPPWQEALARYLDS
mgnify:FL=1